jgi:multidrug efflux system membrane fusion protein
VAVDVAAALLERARVEVDEKTLTTPIAGIVDQIPVERGQAVSEGHTIATVLALDPLGVVGCPAEVRLVGGRMLTGRVAHVSRAAAEKTRTYRVEVEVADPGATIASGPTARIDLPPNRSPRCGCHAPS